MEGVCVHVLWTPQESEGEELRGRGPGREGRREGKEEAEGLEIEDGLGGGRGGERNRGGGSGPLVTRT